MAQAIRNEGAKVNSNINVTPMVDVMLVLLIIFMVITPMLQKGVSVDLAKTTSPVEMKDADKEDALIVAITRDGTVFFGSEMTCTIIKWRGRVPGVSLRSAAKGSPTCSPSVTIA